MRHLALLRGVNVGGARALPMRDLEEVFKAAGATSAATVIQSGNVVFASDDPEATCLAAAIAIQAKFGFRPAVVLRREKDWRAMVVANPFVAAGVSGETLHVACLTAAPDRFAGASVDPRAFLPDEFALAGADVYLRLPNGVAEAKLTNARLDKAFRAVSTMRNWRTVLRLLERLEG